MIDQINTMSRKDESKLDVLDFKQNLYTYKDSVEDKRGLARKKFSDLTVLDVLKKTFSPVRFIASFIKIPFIDYDIANIYFVVPLLSVVSVLLAIMFHAGPAEVIYGTIVLLGVALINALSGVTRRTTCAMLAYISIFLGCHYVLYYTVIPSQEVQQGIIKEYSVKELTGKDFLIVPDKDHRFFEKIAFKANGLADFYTNGQKLEYKWKFQDNDKVCFNSDCLTFTPRSGYVIDNGKKIATLSLTEETKFETISTIAKLEAGFVTSSPEPVKATEQMTVASETQPISQDMIRNIEVATKAMMSLKQYDFRKLKEPNGEHYRVNNLSISAMRDFLKIVSNHSMLSDMIETSEVNMDFRVKSVTPVSVVVSGTIGINGKTNLDLNLKVENGLVTTIQEGK